MRITVKKVKTGQNTHSPPLFWFGLCGLDGGFSCSDKSYVPWDVTMSHYEPVMEK